MGGLFSACSTFGNLKFGDLQVPIGELAPKELVDLAASLPVLVAFKQPFNAVGQVFEARPDPTVGWGPFDLCVVSVMRSGAFRRRSWERA